MTYPWDLKTFIPADHLMKIERYDRIAQKKTTVDYMNVQSRLLWFIGDQRALIVSGKATVPYVIQTDVVEMDREHGYAHFKTFIRDVLGNEVTAYGSETAKDFPDYAEKASTKATGRALLQMGYGTAFATELDEGELIVDAPVVHRPPPRSEVIQESHALSSEQPRMATQQQQTSISKLCSALSQVVPALDMMTEEEAKQRIRELNQEWARRKSVV